MRPPKLTKNDHTIDRGSTMKRCFFENKEHIFSLRLQSCEHHDSTLIEWGRACLGSYDPALVPEAPIGLMKKDSTFRQQGRGGGGE